MFTGLVEETGRVRALRPAKDAWRLQVEAAATLAGAAAGDSIAINGCCLTVTEFDAHSLTFDLLEETRRLTNFASLRDGARVNLERSLRFDGRIGGHFLTGHIDGQGAIEVLERRGADHYLRVRAPAGGARYLVRKGCIAVDGISLTIAETEGDSFSTWIIPTTLAVTNLGEKKPGDGVNLEFDLLAKYVEKITQESALPPNHARRVAGLDG